MVHLRDTYKTVGTGPSNRICFLLIQCGIGDDICALPTIAELAKTHEVTVYCRPFHVALWRALGIRVRMVRGAYGTLVADNGECLDMLWEAKNKPLYSVIYSMNNWGGWEDDTQGASIRGRIQQFADLTGVSLPLTGNIEFYRDTIKPTRIPGIGYTLLATESVESWRSVPITQATTLFDELSLTSFVRWIGERGVSRTRTMERAGSWIELVNLVWNASHVVTVDTGVAHIAAALGRPLTVIGGMTNVRGIFEQYRAYNPGWNFNVVQLSYGGCSSPCYRMPERGFRRGACCGSYIEPQCMASLDAVAVTSIAIT